MVDTDEGVQPIHRSKDYKLKPVFAAGGCGNSGQLFANKRRRSLCDRDERTPITELGLKPIARLVNCASAGVHPRIMGIGPVEAVPKVLKQAGMNMSQIDLVELNEAFARRHWP